MVQCASLIRVPLSLRPYLLLGRQNLEEENSNRERRHFRDHGTFVLFDILRCLLSFQSILIRRTLKLLNHWSIERESLWNRRLFDPLREL